MPPLERDPRTKLLPRNVAALRRGQPASEAAQLAEGNNVSTRLESGVGNCFPGLECDLRNLERRFAPFLECNFRSGTVIAISGVQIDEARAAGAAGALSAAQLQLYERIDSTLVPAPDGTSNWQVTAIGGDFGRLGHIARLRIDQLRTPTENAAGGDPCDAWTAVRMLSEDTPMTLELSEANGAVHTLQSRRNRYLDDDGSLAAMFLPGEMTQSLCSPWTHDFRDCACYYWASNHPDIAQPELPQTAATPVPAEWNRFVDWGRHRLASAATAPTAATADGLLAADQLAYFEINARWEQLHFVVNGRELTQKLGSPPTLGIPYPTEAALEEALREAAGVELAVMQEYLCAYYSLRPPQTATQPADRALRAARAELMRIAMGEMRHLRVVNEILAGLTPPGTPFAPALRVCASIPTADPAVRRQRQFRPLTLAVLDEFIEIESAAHAVDQLYSNIVATLRVRGQNQLVEVASSVIADGGDHLETFQFMREWLQPLGGGALRGANLPMAPANDPRQVALQAAYARLLEQLEQGYRAGMPAGARNVTAARGLMTGEDGIDALAEQLAAAGFLVTFADLPALFAPRP